MIEINYYTLLCDQDFFNAVNKLTNTQLNLRAAIKVKNVAQKIFRAKDTATQEFKEKFGGKYVLLNDEREFVLDPRSPSGLAMVDNSPEFIKEFIKKQDEFMRNKIVLEESKIPLKFFEGFGTFSAQELKSLEPIYTDLLDVV